MISVANPIYDSVFKYLVEDIRIAKTLLSALLKKEIAEVEVRKHEYSNGSRDKISMFRLDFAAQVRQDDGSLKLVLIELQKTWLETETLRFRQYLGTQYSDPSNIMEEKTKDAYGIPMVAVYLLGHRVGDVEAPVVYVNHKSYDYDGNEVTKGVPDPFIESLVHDSIIVQIPLLRGQVNNRLDKVLSVFDQTYTDKYNRQMLNLDENAYADDEEMSRIIRRLLSAASDTKIRQDMNVEEEYFQAIENRDTAIMMRDKKIAERDAMLAEKDGQLAEQAGQIAEKDGQIAEQAGQIAEKDGQLAEKDIALLKSAKALRLTGMSLEEISVLTSLPIDVLKDNL